MDPQLKHHVVDLEVVGPVSVYLQGDLEKLRDGVVFLTVHDIGNSYMTWVNFIMQPSMEEIRKRSLFLHVVVPGQTLDGEELSPKFNFPTCQDLALNLVSILDQMRVTRVIGMGNGAGANIITRFGMAHRTRVHGIITINNTAAATMGRGVMDKVKEKLSALKKEGKKSVNEKNAAKYAEAYKKRTEILTELNNRIDFDVLLIAGMKSRNVEGTENIHREMKPGLCSMIKFEDITEPLLEVPEKTAEAILLFCQGVGLLPTVGRRCSREETNRKNSMSMEEYDKPNVRRFSLTTS